MSQPPPRYRPWTELMRRAFDLDVLGKPFVAGQVLGAGKALDVAEFEDQEDGDEGADAGDRQQPLDAGVVVRGALPRVRSA